MSFAEVVVFPPENYMQERVTHVEKLTTKESISRQIKFRLTIKGKYFGGMNFDMKIALEASHGRRGRKNRFRNICGGGAAAIRVSLTFSKDLIEMCYNES